MKIYSGQYEIGQCGLPTNLIDYHNEPLFVGDIIVMATVDSFGDAGFHGLSVIVEDKPEVCGRTEDLGPFVMGLRSIDTNTSKEWLIKKVKSWEDCVDGEHWKDYGFNYQNK